MQRIWGGTGISVNIDGTIYSDAYVGQCLSLHAVLGGVPSFGTWALLTWVNMRYLNSVLSERTLILVGALVAVSMHGYIDWYTNLA